MTEQTTEPGYAPRRVPLREVIALVLIIVGASALLAGAVMLGGLALGLVVGGMEAIALAVVLGSTP